MYTHRTLLDSTIQPKRGLETQRKCDSLFPYACGFLQPRSCMNRRLCLREQFTKPRAQPTTQNKEKHHCLCDSTNPLSRSTESYYKHLSSLMLPFTTSNPHPQKSSNLTRKTVEAIDAFANIYAAASRNDARGHPFNESC